ncbi:MAG: zinc-ribbon domain-containing protein [Butyrivibrio sp.]|nr:zinc-ribbon domain-containing protein [Butyrivibrio sp.]
MKICPNCGTQVPDDAVFCNNCGSSMAADAAKAAAPTADNNAPVNNQVPAQPQFQQAPYGQPQFQPQPFPAFDPKDHTAEFDPKDIADNKLFAVMPYIVGVLGIIIALLVKDSAFARFHAKNAIRLEIAELLSVIMFIIPILGWIAGAICLVILSVVEIICLVQVLQGKAKDAPIVSGIGFLK